MHPFSYQALPTRVVFGRGTRVQVAAEVERLGRRRVLVLTTPGRAGEGRLLADALGALAAGVFAEAAMHTPADVTERALAALRAAGADCVVALGGGSTTGLGKALASRTGVDQVCVPTTYAGSEMTPILGETREGAKTTVTTLDVLPETVIYDVDLTLGLPPGLSAVSGLNAIAHAVEALYARDRNPIVSLMAEQAILALAEALPVIVREPVDVAARTRALYGAWLSGTCLGSVGMALHHKLCHLLGGSFGLPHAETHAVLLPHSAAYNAEAVPEALAPVAEVFGGTVGGGLYEFAASLNVPHTLRDLGLGASHLDRAADLAVANPYWNPRPVERDAIRALLQRAWEGARPR